MKCSLITDAYAGHGQKRLLIVADCPVTQEFITSLGRSVNASIDLLYIDTSRRTKKGTIYRHISYFNLGLTTQRVYKRYDQLLFWQQFIGIYWGLLNRLFGGKQIAAGFLPLIITRRSGTVGHIALRIFDAALRNENIRFAICHSQDELVHYKSLRSLSAVAHKIKYAPYGCALRGSGMQVTEEYIFSGGTSNRDYATLIEAVRSLEVKLIIACRPEDVNLNNCPPNVQVAFDAYGDAFEKLIADSFLNVIPLKDIRISSGQICLLKAMSYAKPIVATAAAGVEDYIDETCAYLVPPGSSSLMRTAIFNAIMNRDEAIRKGALGYKRFMDKFSVDRLGEIVGGLFNVEAHGLSSLQCDSYCP